LYYTNALRKDLKLSTGDSFAIYVLDKNTIILQKSDKCQAESLLQAVEGDSDKSDQSQ